MPDELDIAGSLAGERIFVTGATGFVGKVLVEKLLWSIPDVGKLLLLVRPDDERDAAARLRDEVLDSPIMARLRARHGDGWESWATSKVEAVAGDLGRDRFGLDDDAWADLCRRVDRVVASAATVRFDERLDRALELNTRGALRTLALARDAGDAPLVHVSTCFVSGRLHGWVPEALLETEPDAPDLDATLAQLDDVCRRLRADPTAAAGGDTPWVTAGAAAAARHGFHDVYTLTKALGERLLARERGAVPVAIARPAIVESALREPIPGWIDAVRVADPLIVAYGRGRTRELPGTADAPLELVPVDFVVNALLAALADLRRGIRVYQIGSSRNPITLGEVMGHAREGFARAPLHDDAGAPIVVPEARFTAPDRLRRRLDARRQRVRALARVVRPLGPARLRARLGATERALEHFGRLIEVYRPYLDHGVRYRDDATRVLWHRLSAAGRAAFPFDVATIDWRRYIARVHVPGIARFALEAGRGAPAAVRPAGAGSPAEAAAHAARADTVFELFAGVARAHHEVVAFQTCRDGRWLRYTYGQALDATANLAWRLATRYRIGHGDRVALWAGGSPEWVIAALAVHRLGAVVVPLDPQWPAADVARAARVVEAKLICAAPPLLDRLVVGAIDAACPAVALASPFVPEPDAGLLPEAEAIATATADGTGGAGDLACILFTSGTTAAAEGTAPKAVPLSHGNYLANVRALVPLMRLEGERLLSVLPIHHAFEQMVGLLVPVAGAGTISYVAKLEPAEIGWMMNSTRPTVLVAVPRLLELLHGGIMRNVEDGGPVLGLLFKVLFALSRATGGRWGHRLFAKVHHRFGGSLRRIATGGSALEPNLGRSFRLMGFAVAEGYGMTETSPVLTVNPWHGIRFGSVGRPIPGVEIELRPPREADLATEPGVGEIWVRGANVMSGYYRNPEATAEVIDNGWLDTGDLGRFDDDGYLYVAGRTKDVIVTDAGKNVYPEEVEARYRGLPGVAELVVLGLPSGRANGGRCERVAAVVVPLAGEGANGNGSDGDVERIRAAIDARAADVPSYQRISRVEIWRGELPKTTTLKVKRAMLRAAILDGARGGNGHRPAPAPAPNEAPPNEAPPNENAAWVLATLARLTRVRPDQLRSSDRLDELGVDSLTRVELVGEIEAHLGRRLDDAAVTGLGRVRDLFELV